jgi:hypothetical protein
MPGRERQLLDPEQTLSKEHAMSNDKQDKATTASPGGDLEHPEHTAHSDNEKSKMPERHDENRKQSPSDRPGKKSGEGEPSVG